MTVASDPVIVVPPVPRHPRLQRFYLLLGVSVFATVVYCSSVKPHTALNCRDCLYDQEDNEVTQHPTSSSPPNLVLVLTDDQDSVLLGASHMPQTLQLLGASGAVLSNAFVASPLCCPSRSSILSGRYVHNHGARNNSVEGGCSNAHWQDGPEKQSLAVHLHSAGYKTFFAGKYLNQYGEPLAGGVAHVPPGWDSWFGLKGNSVYYNYTLSINGAAEQHGSDPAKDYLTKVIWQRAKEFLDSVAPGTGEESDDTNDDSDEASQSTQPFFMMLSTPAAHEPFTPEPNYANNFSDLEAPRTENFNIKNDNTKHWLLRLGEQPLSDDVINKVDGVFRDRLRTLLTVDDMAADVIARLEEKGLLDNTYILFTSDNGYHLGQFSIPHDKREPYEFDIRVPFMVRGPGIAEGTVIPYATINVDLAPTLLDLAGVAVPDYMDGVSLKPLLLQNFDPDEQLTSEPSEDDDMNAWERKLSSSTQTNTEDSYRAADVFARRSILVEHSGEGLEEQPPKGCQGLGAGLYSCNPIYACKCEDSTNNTYTCVRQLFIETTPSLFKVDFSHDDLKGKTSEIHYQNHYEIGQGLSKGKSSKGSIGLHPNHELGTIVTVAEDQQPDRLVSFGDGNQYAGLGVTPIKDVVFCEWDDSEKFVEYYDLSADGDQLHNGASALSSEELAEYKSLLASLMQCQGQSCRDL